MRHCATLLAACSLVGCASAPPAPDPVAPAVLADIAAPLECPEPGLPELPADLSEPLDLAAPQVLPAGQGDYGISRADVELMIDALRAAHVRDQRLRALLQR